MKDNDNTINFRYMCNMFKKNFALRLQQLYSYYDIGFINSKQQHSKESEAFLEVYSLINIASIKFEISEYEIEYQIKAIQNIFKNEGGH